MEVRWISALYARLNDSADLAHHSHSIQDQLIYYSTLLLQARLIIVNLQLGCDRKLLNRQCPHIFVSHFAGVQVSVPDFHARRLGGDCWRDGLLSREIRLPCCVHILPLSHVFRRGTYSHATTAALCIAARSQPRMRRSCIAMLSNQSCLP